MNSESNESSSLTLLNILALLGREIANIPLDSLKNVFFVFSLGGLVEDEVNNGSIPSSLHLKAGDLLLLFAS